MAGDWIKVEVATLDKPEVMRMAELLGVRRDEMVGILFRFWAWLDRSTGNGVVTHTSRFGIDEVMHCAGFGAALESVGWCRFDEVAVTLTVPGFEKHNGNPAKTRALGKDRKREFDERKSNAKCVTKEEKRREEITTKSKTTPVAQSAPVGVRPDVWDAWQRQRGKKLTADAVRLQAKFLAEQPDDPNAVIEQSIRNGWAGLFPLKRDGQVVTSKRAATAAAMLRSAPKDHDDPSDITAESVRVA